MYDVELNGSGTVPNFGLAREQGIAEGKAETRSKKIMSLSPTYFRLDVSLLKEIAKYASVSVSFVREVQEKLSKTKK
jgi:hypothetical protein